jgi:hypothetical protein
VNDMTEVDIKAVVLTVLEDAEIEPGVVLPKGTRLIGQSKRLGVPGFGGKTNWMKPEYKTELDAAQLKKIGVDPGGALATEFDVTAAVRSGKIKIGH